MFLDKYKPTGEKLITYVKKMDATLLPQCFSVVKEKLKRTKYICSIWNDATMAHPPLFNADEWGWKLEDDSYRIKWIEGDMSPTSIIEVAYNWKKDQSNSTGQNDEYSDYEDDILDASDMESD